MRLGVDVTTAYTYVPKTAVEPLTGVGARLLFGSRLRPSGHLIRPRVVVFVPGVAIARPPRRTLDDDRDPVGRFDRRLDGHVGRGKAVVPSAGS
jgi:hypothetical protein